MVLIKTIFFIWVFSASSFAKEWVEVNSQNEEKSKITVLNSSEESIRLNFELSGYYVEETPFGNIISLPGGVSILEKGAPDVPLITTSIQIPNLSKMELSIISSDYVDVPMESIIPSKGNITRDVKLKNVPYEKGYHYSTNKFYPSKTAYLRYPHIIRTKRGQTVVFHPFQYNPVKRTLRVFTKIVIDINKNGLSTENPLIRFPNKLAGIREMDQIYKQHFINYSDILDRYTPLEEDGSMLIISHGPFIESMQPFLIWKNKKGIKTEIIDVAEIGNTSDEIKSYVEDYYYNYGLNFLLLVGDIAQIPSPRFSEGAGSNSPGDPYYGFIPVGDYYPDVFVGRFSAENTEHVSTMVNRTIVYERYPDSNGTWYKEGAGFASDQGPGDDGEYDDEHLDIIRQRLLDYTYNEIDQVYDPTGTVEDGEIAINEGLSLINYTGHGSSGSWGNGCPMNNTDVDGLTNNNMWPWIWSVACVNGEFHMGTCFAETWLRATDSDGLPTGAVATLMATVNQAWNPPMDGQDEMNNIFIESYSNNIKRTFGGLSYNGCMEMIDNYGSAGDVETLYWTIFGDPSFVVRSDTPTDLTVSHENILVIGGSQFTVQTSSSESIAALSKNGELLGVSSADQNGFATITLSSPIEMPGVLDLVVTSYNHIPYEAEINVIAPDGSYMLLDGFSFLSNIDDELVFGQEVHLNTSIENIGNETSGSIIATLIPQNDNITMSTSEASVDSILAGEIKEIGPFIFDVSFNVGNQEQVIFQFIIQDGDQLLEYPIVLTANAPDYSLTSAFIIDGGNGSLDPGENATLNLILENTGSAPLHYPTFSIYTNDGYLAINNLTQDNAFYWDVGTSVLLTTDIEVSEDTPIGYTSIAWITIGMLHEEYNSQLSVPLSVGMILEGFETSDFSAHDWQMNGQSQWSIVQDEVHSGNHSAKSGNIGNNQISELSVTYNILSEGPIVFSAKTSSEQGNSGTIYDGLYFYVDDEQKILIGGDTDWDDYSFNISQGEHTFRWIYSKDQAGSFGNDCVWLDQIIFPPGSIPPLNIDFGDLNQDDNINILDIVLTISSVLSHTSLNSDQFLSADINMDGTVDVIDITLIIDMMFVE